MTAPGWDDDEPWVLDGDGDDALRVAVPGASAAALAAALTDDAFVEELVALAEPLTFVDAEGRPLEASEVTVAVLASVQVCVVALGGVDVDEAQLAEATMLLAALAAWWEPDDSDDDRDDWRVDALDKLAADCRRMLFSRFRPRSDGSFRLKWRARDRELVRDALAVVRTAIETGDDGSTARLFPSPYGDDAEQNAAWGLLARGELTDRRLAALERVEQMMDASRCDADQLGDLMRCINDARLVIGTRLDVTEVGPPLDLSPDDAATYAAYEHLGLLLEQAVAALRTTLPGP